MRPKRQLRTTLLLVGALSFLSCKVSAQGYAPLEAARQMSVAKGLEVRLVASEPLIRQPVAIEFDDRGRLWVIQYLQYPNPSGLKRKTVDRYSRTVYDLVPEPPPRGPKGADCITILEDADGDGRVDRTRDFVTGLNLASGLTFGDGGVYVLQTPYLLFYADKDRDDRPDGDPEVLLAGFGMEDAHSVANSLTWGPDGWLYGLQGSTVTANIRGVEFQQGVWRYHPPTKRFELFCEGGGNMWGLDFDRHGQLFASTNVGGFVMLHGVQGGYYWKSFGKHGPLHNPYSFGYFDHVSHLELSGGHVSVGGLFYEADALPHEWRGRYIAADLLDHSVRAHDVTPFGSTFRARQVADVLRANDTWFAPTDMTLGPDGRLYIADWHDRRTAHPDPDADWDRTNGRIFVIAASGTPSPAQLDCDLTRKTTEELIGLLNHSNVWYRRKARRLLGERRPTGAIERLRSIALEGRGVAALEALWALHACGGLDEKTAEAILGHPESAARLWSVRLFGDEQSVSPSMGSKLVAMAARETDVSVRAQLASTARRLPRSSGLDVARILLERDQDASDPHVPLLIWWAVEVHALADVEDTLTRFSAPWSWESGMCRSVILVRLVRRLAALKNRVGDSACARLLASAPSADRRRPLLGALDEAMRGREAGTVAPELARSILELAKGHIEDITLVRLASRLKFPLALERARTIVKDAQARETDRVAMIDLLGEIKDSASEPLLLDLATTHKDSAMAVRPAAFGALGRFENDAIAKSLLAEYPHQPEPWRLQARELLLSRTAWARVFLQAVDSGEIKSTDVSLEQLSRFGTLRSGDLASLVRKHWGATHGATREERLAEVRRLNNDLRAGPGDLDRGRRLFRERCATCHRLFGDGETIGPDLSYANRHDRDFLLISLVDPTGVVRKEYQAYQVATHDGRVFSGLIVDQSPETITLRDSKGVRTQVARSEIDELRESNVSLMPEALYKEFSPQELRDLFRFLQSEAQPGHEGRP
jgi:putative heme-binding domain-containing protein